MNCIKTSYYGAENATLYIIMGEAGKEQDSTNVYQLKSYENMIC